MLLKLVKSQQPGEEAASAGSSDGGSLCRQVSALSEHHFAAPKDFEPALRKGRPILRRKMNVSTTAAVKLFSDRLRERTQVLPNVRRPSQERVPQLEPDLVVAEPDADFVVACKPGTVGDVERATKR